MFDLKDISFFYFIAMILKNMWDYLVSGWKPGKCFPTLSANMNIVASFNTLREKRKLQARGFRS